MTPLLRAVPLLASALLLLSAAPSAHADKARRRQLSPLSKKAKKAGGGNLRASSGSRATSEAAAFHYPDAALGGCRRGQSDSLVAWASDNDENGYLFRDLFACCVAHFAEAPDACLEVSQEASEPGGYPRAAGGDAFENEMTSTSSSSSIIQMRRLGKSGKHSKTWQGPSPWQKPPQYPQQILWKGGSKSNKSAKSKSSKTVYVPPKPRLPPPPTPKPAPTPVAPTPGGSPDPDLQRVDITMEGMLVAHNLDVPESGTDEMVALAGVFEKTILTVLEEGFECHVTSIGDVPVEGNMFNRQEGLELASDDSPSSDVLFTCMVTKPCPGCSTTDALVLASTIFDETFETLEEKAESGELTTIFCIYAEVANVVVEPCQVTISAAEGTSLAIDMSGDAPAPPTGTKASKAPSLPSVPGPTTKPAMEWPPTPMPSEKPAVSTPGTTGSPVIESTPAETKSPTLAPVMPVTMPPAMIEGTPSPTTSPTAASSEAETEDSLTSTTTATATTPGTTAPPDDTTATTAGTEVPPPVETTTVGTEVPPSTLPPDSGSSVAPTSVPPGAVYYDGFEQGTFPDDPEWTTTGEEGTWILTTDRANSGKYSIQSPVFDLTDVTPKTSNVTLALTDPDFEGGTLVFSVLAGTAMPVDALWIYIDGNMMGDLGMLSEDFERQFIPLGPGPHNVTWSYKFNPAPLPALPPMPPGRIGAAFLDDVYVLQLGATLAPVGAPASGAPSTPAALPAPTTAPSIPAPLVPTPTTPAPAPAVPTTIAPTTIPPGAEWYDGFEQGTFPADPEWTTEGDAPWELTTERAESGVYSIRSPDFFDPDDLTPKTSNVTLMTNPNWDAGALVFSALAGVEMPFDDLQVIVDGVLRSSLNNMQAFEQQQLMLSPGPHTVVFSYKYNPAGVEVFPPEMPGRIGAAFIDDVYFLPEGAELPPTDAPGSPAPEPATSFPTATIVVPTPVPAPTTIAPTTIPPGAEWYDGFEQGTFPEGDPEWTTEGDGLWELTSERANSGVYSIKSPDFFDPEDTTAKTSNVTLVTNPSWDSGALLFSVLAGVNIPFDDFVYYVDGIQRGRLEMMTEFEQQRIELSPGAHTIVFSYKWSPIEGLEFLPPVPPDRIGAVFIDDVYFLPTGAGDAPEPAPTTKPSGVEPPAPGASSPTNAPSYYPTYVPSKIPTEGGEPSPPEGGEPAPPLDAEFFDGFETGDFTGLEWEIAGEEAWAVDDTNPFEGTYSAHIKTEDIAFQGEFSELNLDVDLDEASFLQFYFYAPVSMPFENFELRVDGEFLTSLLTDDETWTQAGAILSAGPHVVSWRLTNNPSGVPPEILENLPEPPFRTGEAWIDNVALLPSTASFTETWETGDFTANPWAFSGDGVWAITDSNASEGTYSASISSEDIEVEGTGMAELSIDIITEQGGALTFSVLPLIEGPFEIANVLVDDISVLTYASVLDDWVEAEVDIQPGKRKVTFQMIGNPGGLPDEVLSTLPSPPGRTGQIWVDNIVFTTNDESPLL
ncbi:hypothetical protein ACHAXT_000305 [Thalassiosira profunda]